MSKYMVAGVEVVSDLRKFPWSKVKNHPLPSLVTSLDQAVSNCATGGTVSASITLTGTTYKLNVTVA